MKKPNRRDFLKLASLTSLTQLPSTLKNSGAKPNIIILVFDALSARNMSLYGYPRKTTPYLENFAKHSTVYHSHYSTGTYTTPGTASLLTGLYPWSHRALVFKSGIREIFTKRNIFNLIKEDYNTFAFTQNLLAEILLDQFHNSINHHFPPSSFSVVDRLIGAKLNDPISRYYAFEYFLTAEDPGSLLFGTANQLLAQETLKSSQSTEYPYGLPQPYHIPIFYKIDDVFKGLAERVKKLPEPFFAYIHVYPPHAPQTPSKLFTELFRDDQWEPQKKPSHPLGDKLSRKDVAESRIQYDQFVAYADWGFQFFYKTLELEGLLQKSHFIVTADHGEILERGVVGHVSPLLSEPGIHIPLIISNPGQTNRKDILTPTNNIDFLPTIAKITGQQVTGEVEGEVLPGFDEKQSHPRTFYTFDAKSGPNMGKLSKTSTALRKGDYKLIYYTGYDDYKGHQKDDKYEFGVFELYNIKNDPEELTDLISIEKDLARSLMDELLAKHKQVLQPVNPD